MPQESGRSAAYEFVFNNVDSVPQLEALLLLWNTRPARWTAGAVCERLYVPMDVARGILRELVRLQLISTKPGDQETFWYEDTSEEMSRTLQWVDQSYRQETVLMSSMIHSKASRAVRDFVRAFRFTKENE